DAARMLGDGVMLRAIVGAGLLVAGAAAGFALPAREQLLVLLVVAAAVLDFSQDAAVWALRAHERLDLESVLLLVSQFAWLAGIPLALQWDAPLGALLATAVAAFLLRTLVGAAMLARLGLAPRFELDRGRLAALVAEGWPVGLSLLLVVVYGRVGVFALKALSSAADVACFNVAYLLSQPFGFLAPALSMAAFPAFARRRGLGRAQLAGPLRAALKYQWLVAVPIAAGLALLADRIVPLLFHDHEGYAQAAAALRVTALALPFVFLNLHARYLLAALGRPRTYLAAVWAGLAVNVAGCALLAHAFGALGAAWTFVAAEALVFVVCQGSLAAVLPPVTLLAEAWRPLVAAALMALGAFEARGLGMWV